MPVHLPSTQNVSSDFFSENSKSMVGESLLFTDTVDSGPGLKQNVKTC